MHIEVNVVPHRAQRYNTVGDWVMKDGTDARGNWNPEFQIFVSDTGSWMHNALLAVHELVEALLCTADGVSQHDVDEFDKYFFIKGWEGEPGDNLDAPYKHQHNFATAVERMLCAAMAIPWQVYDERVDAISREYPAPAKDPIPE